jgi:hypothetical protein
MSKQKYQNAFKLKMDFTIDLMVDTQNINKYIAKRMGN